MRLVETSHANVPGLILFFKIIIFVYEELKPIHHTPESHVRNASHIAGIDGRECDPGKGLNLTPMLPGAELSITRHSI
jgi:hypothetical protein